jgi:hypothetical protein
LRIGTFSVVGFAPIDIADTYGGDGRSASGAFRKLRGQRVQPNRWRVGLFLGRRPAQASVLMSR